MNLEGLDGKKYLHTTRKRFDPLALIISVVGLSSILFTVISYDLSGRLIDLRSITIVVGGTLASVLFQFDFSSSLYSIVLIARSFLGTPDKNILGVLRTLDEAILSESSLTEVSEGSELSGELLNDIVFMNNQGLLFEEIDEFVTSRVADEYLGRQIAVTLLNRAAVIAPALGLFGTVVGLIGVLKSLQNPGEIGPAMSLALMTTAYGAGLGSLVFTPLAGRLEHHNTIFLEVHKQLLNKVGVLLHRDERRLDRVEIPEVAGF